MSNSKTGLIFSEDFSFHQTGQIFIEGPQIFVQAGGKCLSDPFYTPESLGYNLPLPHGAPHPERPDRTGIIFSALEGTGLIKELNLIKPDPVPQKTLEAVHSAAYISKVKSLAGEGGGFLGEGTILTSDSFEIARLSAGAGITALEKLYSGELNSAFILSRPPGHHAREEKAAGFCIFNNVAITARHWLSTNPSGRVLIVDWDVHHGDGTQEIFYKDPRVLYFSLHQFGPPDLYPGTGDFNETGEGPGLGFTVNVPLPGKAGDKLFLEVFEEILPGLVEEFKPGLILVSAGQDGHFNDLNNIYLWDPAGGMALTAQCYHRLMKIVRDLAVKYCDGRYLVFLEGGYDLRNLSNCGLNLVGAMLGLPPLVNEVLPYNFVLENKGSKKIIQKVREARK